MNSQALSGLAARPTIRIKDLYPSFFTGHLIALLVKEAKEVDVLKYGVVPMPPPGYPASAVVAQDGQHRVLVIMEDEYLYADVLRDDFQHIIENQKVPPPVIPAEEINRILDELPNELPGDDPVEYEDIVDNTNRFSAVPSGRPGHAILVREEATSGGYTVETKYVTEDEIYYSEGLESLWHNS